jgi:hypothetical protein
MKAKDIEKCEFSEQCAAHGHLELLKWGLEQNCLLDSVTAFQASKNGHLEILQFVHSEKNCPLTEPCILAAARRGQTEVAKYLLDLGILQANSDKIWVSSSYATDPTEWMEHLAEKGHWRESVITTYVF